MANPRTVLHRLARLLRRSGRVELLVEQNRFLWHEVRRLNERMRNLEAGTMEADATQTRQSFDYQWHEYHEGVSMASDAQFMAGVEDLVARMTDLPPGWFAGKRVLDVGCGAGRFSYALLKLGATVTACDQSSWALQRTAELCRPYAERFAARQVNLLEWDEPGAFDLVFSFGVVHHTGNTYLAIRNAARKVAPGGRLFLMVYGYPETLADYRELNEYEDLRQALRLADYADKKDALIARYGREVAHGYFDAVSPNINDLMTFAELTELLRRFGFGTARRTLPNRNLHVVADKT